MIVVLFSLPISILLLLISQRCKFSDEVQKSQEQYWVEHRYRRNIYIYVLQSSYRHSSIQRYTGSFSYHSIRLSAQSSIGVVAKSVHKIHRPLRVHNLFFRSSMT